MEKKEIMAGINQCLDIAGRYDEPWGLVVFEKLLERFLADFNDGKIDETQPDTPSNGESTGKAQPSILKLSKLIGVEVEQLLEVYGFEDDAPVIKQYDFKGKNRTEKAREVSGLYLLACTVVCNKEYVPIKDLTLVAQQWNVYDPSNFTTNHIGKCRWFHRTADRVKLLLPARYEIALIVKRILGIDAS